MDNEGRSHTVAVDYKQLTQLPLVSFGSSYRSAIEEVSSSSSSSVEEVRSSSPFGEISSSKSSSIGKTKSHMAQNGTLYTLCHQAHLGNLMFCLAAAIGIANATSRRIVLDEWTHSYMSESFTSQVTSQYTVGAPANYCEEANLPILRPKGNANSFDDKFFSLPAGDVCTYGHFQSWRYFLDSTMEIKRIFKQFKSQFWDAARSRMQEIKATIKTHDATYIGLHIRRGDYARMNNTDVYIMPDEAYIENVFAFCNEKYESPIFIMVSSDQQWAIENFADVPNVIFAGSNDKTTDMVILTMCDHVVLTMGTFGWWGAFLGDSKTVLYPDIVYVKDNRAEVRKKNYYFPSWTPIHNPAVNASIRQQISS